MTHAHCRWLARELGEGKESETQLETCSFASVDYDRLADRMLLVNASPIHATDQAYRCRYLLLETASLMHLTTTVDM